MIRLSHVALFASGPVLSRASNIDMPGLQVTVEDADRNQLCAVQLRGHHCVSLRKGVGRDVGIQGFKVWNDVVKCLSNMKFRVTEYTADQHMGRTWAACANRQRRDHSRPAPARRPRGDGQQ